MMSHQLELPTAPRPVAALIFFTNEASTGFVTRHEVDLDENGPVIGSGTLLAPEHLEKMVRLSLGKKESRHTRISMFPRNLLYQDPASLAWYSPARVAPMWFATRKGTRRALSVPWPALVFCVRNGSPPRLRVVAVRTRRLPQSQTRTYVAPLMNTDVRTGSVCLPGGATLPGLKVADIPKWEDIMYRTYFSHLASDAWPMRQTKPESGQRSAEQAYLRFWTELHRRKESRFPEERLLSRQCTVEQFLNQPS
jgi:PRTRC genetic system protein B